MKMVTLLLLQQLNMSKHVMPDLIRHPVFSVDSAPVFTGVTRRNDKIKYLIAWVITILLVWQFALPVPVEAATSAETLQSLAARLESWEVEDIWPEVLTTLAQYPQDAGILATAADIAYHRGDYQESLRLMKSSLEVGGEDEQRRGFAIFIEETIKVLAPYKRYESPHFIITLDERQDGILADYLIDALEKTQKAMDQRYGFTPREKVRVELFPDSVAFYRGSALSVRDIEVTGAVGLTKFNKLQFLSPRAMVNGYRWLDAVSHEYMHYMIIKMSSNKAPIWFHEGLAKYEETSWRDGPSYLSALNRTLLAQALTEKNLIPFEKMEPSLLQLQTPEEVQLAYAQSASTIEFIIGSAGLDGLKRIMTRMVKSLTSGAGESIHEVLGLEFPVFEQKWKQFLTAKALKPVAGVNIRRYKVREGERDDSGMDLKEIQSLVARNRAHLGDRLKEIGRLRAAALEYRRALTETRDSVPVMNRLSAVLLELAQHEEALNVLKRTLELDPDHPTPHTQLGQIYWQRKDFQQARKAFEESIQINPFNPLVHLGLADAYAALGDGPGAAKERAIAQKLRR